MVQGKLVDTNKTNLMRMGMAMADGKTSEGKEFLVSHTFDNKVTVIYGHYEVTYDIGEMVSEALGLIQREEHGKEQVVP